MDELARTLDQSKFAKYELAPDDVRDLIRSIAIALPTVDLDVEIRDPSDAPFVEAALAGRAEAIVTGDADLLDNTELGRWLEDRGVRILTPRQLLDELG